MPKPPAISGADGSVAAFLGIAAKGPIGVGAPLGDLAEFEATYAGGQSRARSDGGTASNYLWHAAQGFFDNGGRRLVVVRIETPAGTEVDDRAVANALTALDANEEVSLLCAPGLDMVQGHRRLCEMLLLHCEAGHGRFALLDTRSDTSSGEAAALRGALRSDNGALYYPWIAVQASPASPRRGDRQTVLVPPSGHLAGLYADSDDQPGTHKAPANLPLAGALALERPIADSDYAELAPAGVNCLRSAPGRSGVWVWGARTLNADSEWNYVAVRRYTLYLERSLHRGLQRIGSEANDERLWAEIVALVSDFLFREWRMGALMGAKPEEAYCVRCDRSTMTQADIDAGRTVVLTGIALLQPSEFLFLRIGFELERLCAYRSGLTGLDWRGGAGNSGIRIADGCCARPGRAG